MNRELMWLVLAGAGGVTAASVGVLSQAIHPPDATATTLGVAWVGGPWGVAAGLAWLGRRRQGVLVALLVTIVAAGAIGVYLYDHTADKMLAARHETQTAVQPGEDPNSGPGGMRKAAAGASEFFTDVFGGVVVAAVAPAQLAAVLLAAGVGWIASRRTVGVDAVPAAQ